MIGKSNAITTSGGGVNIIECTSDYISSVYFEPSVVTFTHNLGKQPEHYILVATSYYTDNYGSYGMTKTRHGQSIQSIIDGAIRCTQAQNSNNTGEYKILAPTGGTLSVTHTATTSTFSMSYYSGSPSMFIGVYKLWVW